MNVWWAFFLFLTVQLSADIDLQRFKQDFVLETIQVAIPGHPKAFNPSLIRWQEGYLMSFRVRDINDFPINRTGLIRLDRNFCPIGLPQMLTLERDPAVDTRAQDVRLCVAGEDLFIVYNQLASKTRLMSVAKLLFDGESFFVEKPELLSRIGNFRLNIIEKNWVPFDYKGSLLLGYSLSPHRILRPIFDTESCEILATSQGAFRWDWGVLRGGTPALLDGEQYLAFFHTSSWSMSEGKKVLCYFMGAYTFAGQPPFQITRISPYPIVCNEFYAGEPIPIEGFDELFLRALFPTGFIFDEDDVYVAYGKQDCETWIVKLNKKKLLESLVPVFPRP